MVIGIFDSGLGGLVFLKELLDQHKYAHYVFYGDYKHNPLGNKNDMQLRKYFESAMSFFLQHHCDQIIVACNTMASVIENSNYKVLTPIPFVIHKILQNRDKVFLILATKKTIASQIYHQPNTMNIACPLFVKKLEKNPKQDMIPYLDYYLKGYQKFDGIVLGCTHYSLLQHDLKQYIHRDILIIDSCKELANHVAPFNEQLQIEIYLTKQNPTILRNIYWLFQNYKISIKQI